MKISIPYIMRYRIQVILILFPAILWGCNFHKKNQQADSDFKILEQEQIEAQQHEGLIPPFRQVIKDFQEFKTILYSAVGLAVVLAAFVLTNIVSDLATSAFGTAQ